MKTDPNALRPRFEAIYGPPGERYEPETWRLLWRAYLAGYRAKRLTRLELMTLLIAGAMVENDIREELKG